MKKNQNHHNSFLVIYQKNRGIVEHKCNLDDISIKIQCFSNADRLNKRQITHFTEHTVTEEPKVDLWEKA